ncbi:MAG: EVE domain-containing protein [Gemmatimonadota bacterium]
MTAKKDKKPSAASAGDTSRAGKRFWLVKTEPGSFSWDDLVKSPRRTTGWSGVRNFQARNFMRDGMKKGDEVLFYHSSTANPEVVGIAAVVREAYPDPTAFDRKSPWYDPRSSPSAPVWMQVDVRADHKFPRAVSLATLRATASLTGMFLLRKGNRLSVQPVYEAEWWEVLALGGIRRS